MKRGGNPWDETFYNRVILRKIGQGLKEVYEQDVARPLPHRMFTLLMQLSQQRKPQRAKTTRTEKRARRAT
jgi:Anti-sigma factor NepR